MKYSDNLAKNLKSFFELNDLSTNAVATASNVPQKTIWVCLNGTVAPSVNTAAVVADAVGCDSSILMRKEYNPQQVKNSKRVGKIADLLMELPTDQLRLLEDMIGNQVKSSS